MPIPPRPAKVVRLSSFEGFLRNISQDVARTVEAKIKAMEKDWTDPWLDKRKMGGYDSKWRFKVNSQYRMVAEKKEGDEFHLEFVGTKNQFKKRYKGSS